MKKILSLAIAVLFTLNTISWAGPAQQNTLRAVSTGQKNRTEKTKPLHRQKPSALKVALDTILPEKPFLVSPDSSALQSQVAEEIEQALAEPATSIGDEISKTPHQSHYHRVLSILSKLKPGQGLKGDVVTYRLTKSGRVIIHLKTDFADYVRVYSLNEKNQLAKTDRYGKPVMALPILTGLEDAVRDFLKVRAGQQKQPPKTQPKSSSAGEHRVKVDGFTFTCADPAGKVAMLLGLERPLKQRLNKAVPRLVVRNQKIIEIDKPPEQKVELSDIDPSFIPPALRITRAKAYFIVFVKMDKDTFLPILIRRVSEARYQIDIITGIRQSDINRLIDIAGSQEQTQAQRLILAVLDHYAKQKKQRLAEMFLHADEIIQVGRFAIEVTNITISDLQKKGLHFGPSASLKEGLARLSKEMGKKTGYRVLYKELIQPAFGGVSVSAYIGIPDSCSAYLVLVKPDKPGFTDIPILIRIKGRHNLKSFIARPTPRQLLEISRASSISSTEQQVLEHLINQLQQRGAKFSSAGTKEVSTTAVVLEQGIKSWQRINHSA